MKRSSKVKSRRALYAGTAIFLLVAGLLAGFSALVLVRAGEYKPLAQVIERQAETKGLYGPALPRSISAYKQKLFDRYRPDAVALGSSRMLQFRAEDFNAPFINLGGTGSLAETAGLARTLFGGHKPGLVILGLDFWWFRGGSVFPDAAAGSTEPGMRPGDLLRPYAWLAGNRLDSGDLQTILSEDTPHTGTWAIAAGDGYDAAGAYHSTSVWTGRTQADKGFGKSLAKVARGEGPYAAGEEIDEKQWQMLIALLDDLAAQKLNVVLLLPPVAPGVLDAMTQAAKYRYIDRLRLRLSETAAAYRFPLFDDHDIRFAGGTDCEFTDAVRGGPVVYKRVLLDMAVREPSVRERANLSALGWAIETYRGRASTLADEADFLQLGCMKPTLKLAKNM